MRGLVPVGMAHLYVMGMAPRGTLEGPHTPCHTGQEGPTPVTCQGSQE